MVSGLLSLLSVSLLATVANAGIDAWHMDNVYTIANEMLDPIVNPNGQSSHMHKIVGGSGIHAAYSSDVYKNAKCTSVNIKADKSNYWMPNLYWINDPANPATTTFTSIPAIVRFYYFLPRTSGDQPVEPFPEGLRMLVGDPNSKTDDKSGLFLFGCQTQSDFTNTIYKSNFNFDHICPWGVKTEVHFPQCWDGVNLWKDDMTHMSYPVGWPGNADVRNGACPASHPVRVPTILLEYTWHQEDVAPGQVVNGHLAWANGDTTGAGIHGDFVAGWDTAVLRKALNDPGCVNKGFSMPMENCPSLAPYHDIGSAQRCNVPDKGFLAQPGGNGDKVTLPKLPGCNPIWSSGPKPSCNPPVAGLNVGPYTGTDGPRTVSAADRRDFKLPANGTGWQYAGCFADDDWNPTFTPRTAFIDGAMTTERCTSACAAAGMPFAALELRGGFRCTCAPAGALNMGASLFNVSQCSQPCPGNAKQICGDTYRMATYYTSDTTLTEAADAYDKGCYSSPGPTTGLLGASDYNFNSNTMTNDVCAKACVARNSTWFGTYYGNTCYCGKTYDLGAGSFIPRDQCTRKCFGNSSEVCGDLYKLSVFNLTNAQIELDTYNHPAGYAGCYAEGNGVMALSGNAWSLNTMTVPQCLNGCSELGYKYAGLKSGNQCNCGDQFNGGIKLPYSQCQTMCTGNSTQTCGGDNRVELFNTTAATVTPATQRAARTPGYLGCFVDSGTTLALTAYKYSSTSMTNDLCKTACAEMKYTYSGVENTQTCKCDNKPIATRQMPASWCSTKCPGNSTQTCGAPGYIDAYNASVVAAPDYASTRPDGWLGCYADYTNAPGLTDYFFESGSMTIEKCMKGCKELGYGLAGAEYATQCKCGNVYKGGQMLPATSCDMKCKGNTSQTCGGSYKMSMYNTTSAAVVKAKPTGWLGCYSDSATKRALTDYSYSLSSMTTSVCRLACSQRGYAYAGLEAGNQCFCGDVMTGGILPESACYTPCAGNATETCGANWIMDVFNTTGAAIKTNGVKGYAGCYTDRLTLNGYSYKSSIMNANVCNAQCKSRGFTYAGTEDGNVCRCGNTKPTVISGTATCNSACVGSTDKETCGSASTISLYTVAEAQNVLNVTYGTKGFMNCWLEGNNGKLLTGYKYKSSAMTTDACLSTCKNMNYKYGGTEYGEECYCSNDLNVAGNGYIVASSECNMACKGASTETCGASYRLSLYDVAKSGVASAAKPEGYKGCFSSSDFTTNPPYRTWASYMTTGLCRRTCRNKGFSIAGLSGGNTCSCSNAATYGGLGSDQLCTQNCQGDTKAKCGDINMVSIYDTTGAGSLPPTAGFPANYVGCFQDVAAARELNNYTVTFSSTNSYATCSAACRAKGLAVVGTQFGNQCFCGTKLPTLLLPDTTCTMACTGATGEKCGGSNLLSVYDLNLSGKVAAVSSSASTAVSSASSSKASSVTSINTSIKSTPGIIGTVSPSTTQTGVTSASTTSKASSAAAAASSSTSKASSAATASSAKASSATTVSTTLNAPVGIAEPSALTMTRSETGTAASSAAASSAASSAAASSAAASSAAASSATTSSTTSSAAAASTSLVSTPYQGCFNDYYENPVLVEVNMTSPLLTVPQCQLWCRVNGYALAGMRDGTYCGCARAGARSVLKSVAADQCNVECKGDRNTQCGGKTALSLYTTYATVPPTKEPTKRRSHRTTKRFAKLLRS